MGAWSGPPGRIEVLKEAMDELLEGSGGTLGDVRVTLTDERVPGVRGFILRAMDWFCRRLFGVPW